MRKEDNEFYEKVCKNIRQILQDLDMSYVELAEKIGSSSSVELNKKLRCEYKLSIRELYLITKAIDCDFDEVVNGYAE